MILKTRCWVWTRTISPQGYGKIWTKGQSVSVHRVSWEIHNSPLDKKAHVCHRCDLPKCVNPDHLFIGSALDNVHDKIKKGRMTITSFRTTPAMRKAMRARWKSGVKQTQVAKEFGVCLRTVSRACTTKESMR
jgi:hypothetical protein